MLAVAVVVQTLLRHLAVRAVEEILVPFLQASELLQRLILVAAAAAVLAVVLSVEVEVTVVLVL
jgi:hypothetical protein